MERMIQAAVLAAALVLPGSAAAKISALEIEEKDFSEQRLDEARAAPQTTAGVMYNSSLHRARPDALFVDLRTLSQVTLCGTVTSRDGLYHAEFSYRLTGDGLGKVRLVLPSEMEDVYNRYPPDQIAVFLTIRNSCNGRIIRVLPAGWGRPSTPGLMVYLHTDEGMATLKLIRKSGNSQLVICDIDTDDSKGFDAACEIKQPDKIKLKKTKALLTDRDENLNSVKLPIN